MPETFEIKTQNTKGDLEKRNGKNGSSNGKLRLFSKEEMAVLAKGQMDQVKKRDGRLTDFDINRISSAIYLAMQVTQEGGDKEAVNVARLVYQSLLENKRFANGHGYVPGVEEIQDLVEEQLIYAGFAKTAKAYILYRKEHNDLRVKRGAVSNEIKDAVRQSSTYFQNTLAEVVYYRTYSRWQDELGRRETWSETVDRYIGFMQENLGKKLSQREYSELRNAILTQQIIPSMRLMWSSGKAAQATNVAAYNCSFIAPAKIQDFGEIMYILMCGTGLGFSVESQTAQQLPIIKKQTGKKKRSHVIADSKEGWADAFVKGLKTWYQGGDIDFDYSKLRPRGARLKTMGGRSSGPQPLIDLIDFSKKKILSKQGRRLSNLDVHDIVCKIGEIVVAGGVRRSALLSLSDLDDDEMRRAKMGQFFNTEPQRSMANNSATYVNKPSATEFLDEWISLMKSGSGERGIFNRDGLARQLPKRRFKINKSKIDYFGANPCGEIYLRNKQFCNLTGIVVRQEDDSRSLMRKIRLATILGTYQATLTDFPYLSKEWKKNCEEEALLGVSLTGFYDNEEIRRPDMLAKMRDYAVDVNKKYAKRLGINQSTCVTTVKPSGNSSQLLNTSSGMHPRYSKYYIRRVRISSTDPLFHMLKDQGVPHYPEVGQHEDTATSFVLEFPVKSPKGAVTRDEVSALDLLESWKNLKENYTEHNPSVTIYVDEDEWIKVANWLYQNWEILGGLSFLPKSNHIYQLAPYEPIDKKAYDELVKKTKNIDFSKLSLYEQTDHTQGAKEYACVAGACEL